MSAQRPRLVTLKKAAAQLGVPYTSLREAALRGEFPLIRIGSGRGALYAAWADLDRWLESRKETAA